MVLTRSAISSTADDGAIDENEPSPLRFNE
jgi:hypothetical protein